MRSILSSLSAAIAGMALAAVLVAPGPAAAEPRNRALERVVAKGMFNADEGARLQRAFAAAGQAGVEERDALALVEAGVDGEFDAAQVLRLLSLASQLALEDLPVEGFRSKVEEGVSKRVSPSRIVQAAERRALMLSKAKQILNSLVLQGIQVDDRDELLPDLAEALEAGRPPEEARAILTEAFKSGERPGSIRRMLFP